MKGIVLAGGTGSRLYPLTYGTSKQMLPLYDKPMIYYPISTLMLAGIRDILLIVCPEDQNRFERLLGDGSRFGIRLHYKVQPYPEGIAQAFTIGEDFIGEDSVCLVLGDNIFYGNAFSEVLKRAAQQTLGATVFGSKVKDPQRFGVIEFDSSNRVLSIEEKPEVPKSDYAVTGLYFYDNRVVQWAKEVERSYRGELEITSINQRYLEDKSLNVELLGRGFAWLDTGTHESLHEASSFVQTLEHVQGVKVACLEEIAWRNGWLSSQDIEYIAQPLLNNGYGQYLVSLIG
ncbi:glucose-1-phosphate thymidylyltransferase RfbA [Vibrio pectenicida]|uniref:Glucose-1-phosphate thymidylyltransferase n=1 Tax=Vibrio pectenicida TaxID=62763 RepID=A0A3R9EG50_9VIBR|nr:glucose-1-phosphate thymidylyltransferase RfbA [Vibrio pectenicida]NOH71649.1 glucose-1-phosphate thymidylyltransferase RfbA [Vibrio pectenicida]RSD29620.1 glucose-1-phosphate thymidylyltransferase [Vibrio pectenicida]